MTHPTSRERSKLRSRILLAIGAAVGITLAASGILRPLDDKDGGLPPGTVARVNDALIAEEEYLRTVQRLASDKRNELTEEDRRHVLRRLIEEELLIQRGVEIGLVGSDPSVRKSIAAAMIQSIVGEISSLQPESDELEKFYKENQSLFARPGRFRVQQIAFLTNRGNALARAREAEHALESGSSFEVVQERFGDRVVLALPDVPLPPHKLQEYLGPTLARAAMSLDPGGVTGPLQSPSGVRILRLVESEPSQTLPFEEIADQVEAEYRRRAADDALRGYLDWLVDEADIVMAETVPQ